MEPVPWSGIYGNGRDYLFVVEKTRFLLFLITLKSLKFVIFGESKKKTGISL